MIAIEEVGITLTMPVVYDGLINSEALYAAICKRVWELSRGINIPRSLEAFGEFVKNWDALNAQKRQGDGFSGRNMALWLSLRGQAEALWGTPDLGDDWHILSRTLVEIDRLAASLDAGNETEIYKLNDSVLIPLIDKWWGDNSKPRPCSTKTAVNTYYQWVKYHEIKIGTKKLSGRAKKPDADTTITSKLLMPIMVYALTNCNLYIEVNSEQKQINSINDLITIDRSLG